MLLLQVTQIMAPAYLHVSGLVKRIKLQQPACCHFEDLSIFHSVTLNFFGFYEVFVLTAPAHIALLTTNVSPVHPPVA